MIRKVLCGIGAAGIMGAGVVVLWYGLPLLLVLHTRLGMISPPPYENSPHWVHVLGGVLCVAQDVAALFVVGFALFLWFTLYDKCHAYWTGGA